MKVFFKVFLSGSNSVDCSNAEQARLALRNITSLLQSFIKNIISERRSETSIMLVYRLSGGSGVE